MDSSMEPSKLVGNDTAGLIGREISNLEGSLEYNAPAEDELFNSTVLDARDMRRMGKSQELIRHYRLDSMVAFAGLAGPAWELALFQVTPGIINGGLPMLIYSNIWCFVGFLPVVLSLAEMASMAPIAGAQYHWVSEFAPEKYQKLLSYLTGWTATLSYQAGNATGFILIGTLIQSIILLNKPDYGFPNWQATLLAIAAIVFVILCNYFGSRLLPRWQNPAFAIHILAYLAFLVPVWKNAPKASAKQVWTEIENRGGWSSLPLSIMIGQFPAIAAQTTVDAALHMSEEVRDASRSIPKVIVSIYMINFVLNLTTVLTICYHITSVQDALDDPTSYPAVYVIAQAMSIKWVSVLLAVIVALILVASVSYFVAVSRQLYAFSRDRGIPFSRWVSKIDQGRHIPTNAYILSGVISVLLSLIYIVLYL
ncbi:hypothetical protein TWF696_002572 [Orbilia brochopaga]|uniref:Amino acid transporter n=1 Tax=Orbilia brochopaga TaxID=3140254 RepID=A0AAV9U2I9_9PEZI